MKASIVAASVALVGSVAASQHKAHAGFHLRRGAEQSDDVCTVYTTVYVTALPSIVPNSTVYGHPTAYSSSSSSCTESVKTPVYTPYVLSSTEEAPAPSAPAPAPSAPAPAPSAPAPVPSAPAPKPSPPAPAPVPTEAVYTPAPKPETSAPAPAPSAPAPKPSPPAPAPVPSKEVYTPAPKPETSKAAPVSTPQAYPTKPAEKPKPVPSSTKVAEKPKPTGSYSGGGRIVTNGEKWAITYTPYADNGDCKTADEIKADIKKISELGFTTIRSYSTDCGVFESVVPECQKYGLKVIYGIFLEGAGKGTFSDYANAQLDDIKNNAPKDSVAMVIVGNECMFNNNCEAAELGSYIDYVREQLHSSGFPKDIAVTTTEPVGTWEEKGAALCAHIDVFTVQVHPYFTQSVTAEMAGDFAAQQLEQAAKVCPEAAAKGKYITEIGWPSAGQTNGKAIAGVAEQKVAMKKIQEKVGAEACLFSFQNDPWKAAGSLDVEQNFGCIEALY